MALEAGSFISDLTTTNPPGSDTKAQGDDHFRLVKTVLRGTFPNASKVFYFPGLAAKTTNYTVAIGDMNSLLSMDATAGARIFTLPVNLGVGAAGFMVQLMKIDSSANAVAVTPTSGTINGVASISLSRQYSGLFAIWTGTSWLGWRLMNSAGLLDGNVGIAGNLDVDGTLNVDGAAQIDGALNIDGAVDIDSTLNVDGAVTFQSSVQVGGILWGVEQTLTDGATIAWDMSAGPNAKVTMAGNRAFGAPSGEQIGAFGLLRLIQDAVGGRIPTWSAQYHGPRGTIPERPGQGANEETLYLYYVRAANDVLLSRLVVTGQDTIGTFREYDLGIYAISVQKDQAHGLGKYPPLVQGILECVSGNLNYTVGDRIPFTFLTGGGDAATVVMYTTGIVRVISTNNLPELPTNAIGSVSSSMTAGSWRVFVRVYE